MTQTVWTVCVAAALWRTSEGRDHPRRREHPPCWDGAVSTHTSHRTGGAGGTGTSGGQQETETHLHTVDRKIMWNKLCVMRTVLFLCSSPSWSDWQMRGWRRARPPVRGDKSILHRAGERRCEIRFPKTKNWSVCGTGTHRFLSSGSHTACCL